uniref:Uncharacterized protein n=1 Tax=Panagrolaimus superbus TaxID=310955 RepID=A0A914Z3E2_9BILA
MKINNSETEEFPPNLDIFNSTSAVEDSEEEEPPQLECEIKEKMAVTRSQNNFSRSDNPLQTISKSLRKAPKKRGNDLKSENFPLITKFEEVDFDAPPALDLYGDKQTQFRASSTSSGISSIGEFHSPPSCSPLAPINGNFTRSKPVVKEPTAPRNVTKRKSKTPPTSEKSYSKF